MAPTLRACVFCGADGKLTGEHVFGDWLAGTGLPVGPSRQGSGPLNRSLRDLGIARPFRLTVKDVCGPCNNGWMSALEGAAKRALEPLLLGAPGEVLPRDHPGVAAWALKTALVAMLVSSKEERAGGRGLPSSEYRALYAIRARGAPLPNTQFWMGRYRGHRLTAAWTTPIVLQVDGLPEPELPHGYVASVVVGQVLLQGIRFTSPLMEVDLENTAGFARVWLN